MRVLFAIPNLGYADHIAIAYLSAVARELGHSTYFCTLDANSLPDMVSRIQPHVVGYSANTVGFASLVAAHREARLVHEFVSIMGGPHPTLSPGTFAESTMDAYCVGEGDYAFRDFLIRVNNGQPYDDVLNLITSRGANPVRPLIKNLDELPMPDRDLTLNNSFLKDTSKKNFYATRGCPFSCAYCCNNYYHKLYKGLGPLVRRFSVERLLQEIEDVQSKYRMDFIKFGDDCFVLKADEWLEVFAEEYPRRVGVPFNCYLRLDLVSDRMLALLKKAGCFSVHISVDSTSQHVRDEVFRRRMRGDCIAPNLRKIREYGINTCVNYMLAAPDSTLQDDLDTIELNRACDVTYATYTTTVLYPGTDLYEYGKHLLPPNDGGNFFGRSALTCFSGRDKATRYNVALLGAIASKLPGLLHKAAMWLIRVVPPNRFFLKLRWLFYDYAMSHTIFKLKGDRDESRENEVKRRFAD